MKLKHLLYGALIMLAATIKSSAAGLPVQEVPFELCVSTDIALTNAVVSTVPASVNYSTSATGSPVTSVNNWKRIEFTNTGQSPFFVGFNVGVSATTGRLVSISSQGVPTWDLPIMSNVRTWIVPSGTNGRANITYCR